MTHQDVFFWGFAVGAMAVGCLWFLRVCWEIHAACGRAIDICRRMEADCDHMAEILKEEPE